jgi:hypothetical protein
MEGEEASMGLGWKNWSNLNRDVSILIDDFEAHLAGGAGDDLESSFVVT